MLKIRWMRLKRFGEEKNRGHALFVDETNWTNLHHPRLLTMLIEGNIEGKNFLGRKNRRSEYVDQIVKDPGCCGYAR